MEMINDSHCVALLSKIYQTNYSNFSDMNKMNTRIAWYDHLSIYYMLNILFLLYSEWNKVTTYDARHYYKPQTISHLNKSSSFSFASLRKFLG